MTQKEMAVIAVFIFLGVATQLSLVTGMPHYELGEAADVTVERTADKADQFEKKKSWRGFQDLLQNLDTNNDDAAQDRAEYQRFLGIDPLANSFLNEMNANEGEEKHMVRKRVLPFSDELQKANQPGVGLDLMETGENKDGPGL